MIQDEDKSSLFHNEYHFNRNSSHHFKVNTFVECFYNQKFYTARCIEVNLTENSFKLELDTTTSTTSMNPTIKSTKILSFRNTSNTSLNSTQSNLNSYYPNLNHTIFPCNWCLQNNLKLELPFEWYNQKREDLEKNPNYFDWDLYIDILNKNDENEKIVNFNQMTDISLLNWSTRQLNQLNDKFLIGSYLEFVLPNDNENDGKMICLGKICAKVGHLIYVKNVENIKYHQNNTETKLYIFTIDSLDLYPVGWCEMNNYKSNYYNSTFLKQQQQPSETTIQLNTIIRDDFFKIPALAQFKSILKN
jgi:hypothetical protein